ncbi:MAG TPA: FecR domain-containing protein [Anaerohalosphaeraceae bacterium]|nr:FecR domain-containing protein [Anaerohalosphaeraceae bacterium]HQG05132.1 FecR domain-containing protein [Anaerohalosphaeraceae bacterium]HQI06305.1 FecR domain-containing protein [Anaerohalosphaeraceae bacterium]HQJ67075.1 FecR domain-containing protein [Anaerohalosphaeraceae bacterium]
MDEKEISKITVYTLKLVEQTIGPEEFEELNSILSANPDAARHYNSLMMMISNFQDRGKEIVYDEITIEGALKNAFWKEMADYERTALAVEISKEEPEKEDKTLTEIRKIRPKVSKLSIYSLLLCSATLIFVIAYAHLISMRHGIEVATLSDSMNAKWADIASPVEKGTRLVTGEKRWLLREGYAELLFDNQARVVLEGPAEFKILAEDRIGLSFGKVYATVPKNAIGFSVYTPIAKIIDMGTEFGVEADLGGNTQLHVFEGRTVLLVGQNDHTINVKVSAGQARNASGSTQTITEIPLHENYFVRTFDSTQNIVWRQPLLLDLADIVRNGNGLGTGNSQMRLNYIKGFTTEHRGGETLIAKNYLPIKSHPFIDGIFIPNGRTVVSSRGDVFEDFLITSGVHCADLFGNPPPGMYYLDAQQRTVQFNGQEYSERGKSCIFMPGSNHGITFDLDAIRRHYNLKIDRFTSRVGLADFDDKRCNANFYVLVDGQLRYSLLGYSQKGVLNDVSVKLEDTDRFLTLATSENVDQIDYMANSTLRENFCVFAEPVLVLKRIDSMQR